MKPLYTAQEWLEIDQDTINFHQMTPWDLMELASQSLFERLKDLLPAQQPIHVVVGSGNNGGDGLAVARLLQQSHYEVYVWYFQMHDHPSEAWQENRRRYDGPFQEIHDLTLFETNIRGQVIVEGLLGVGTRRAVVGKLKEIIEILNEKSGFRVALDMPAGLRADTPTLPLEGIFEANVTVTCHQPKLSLLLPDYQDYVGELDLAPIPIFEKRFSKTSQSGMYWLDSVEALLPKRDRFGHKGTYGHVLVVAGSETMPGAAYLTTKACLRMGAGKVTCASDSSVVQHLPWIIPEAMKRDVQSLIWRDLASQYQAIAVGPGWSTSPERLDWLREILQLPIPLVVDADALNLLADYRELLTSLPPHTILTPHPKEFERLLRHRWKHDFDKLVFLRQFATTYQVIVCLKGAYTCIAMPDGRLVFNSTGNPGMGTAGSGDVLTGMIAAWLAQGVSPEKAALLGVFLHGTAGDRAAQQRSERALMASDILDAIR